MNLNGDMGLLWHSEENGLQQNLIHHIGPDLRLLICRSTEGAIIREIFENLWLPIKRENHDLQPNRQ